MHLFHDATFWYGVSFVLFFVLLGRTLKTRFRSRMQIYQERLAHQFREAQSLLAEAESALTKAQDQGHALEETLRASSRHAQERLERRLKQLEDDCILVQNRRQAMLVSQLAHLEVTTQNALRQTIATKVNETLTAYWLANPRGADFETLETITPH